MEIHLLHSKPRSVHFVRHSFSFFLKVLLHGCAGPQRGRGAGVAQASKPADDVCKPADCVCRPRAAIIRKQLVVGRALEAADGASRALHAIPEAVLPNLEEDKLN